MEKPTGMNNDEYFSNINVNDIAVFYLYKVQACFFFYRIMIFYAILSLYLNKL